METAGRSVAACEALQHEHGALLRYLGRLQQGLGAQLVRLETENLRLRAALLLARTAALWGLAPLPVARATGGRIVAAQAEPPGKPATNVSALLCRVACEGHAHPWLDEEGLCRRSGEGCERLASVEPLQR